MNLFLAFLLLQAVPTGAVSGVVRGPDGMPAAKVRVYAMILRDVANAPADATVLEGITETDSAGRYRLDIPPGRYYIASGSVDAPTYYPDTADRGAARPVTVTSGAKIEEIDFSRYVAPRSSAAISVTFASFGAAFGLLPSPPPVGATLSGVIRLPDGAPARDMEVIAVPEPRGTSQSVSPRNIPTTAVVRGRADATGRFRLPYVAAGKHYIVSGTPDSISIYPGTSEIGKATAVTVATQDIGNLDFTVSGVVVSGRVLASGGTPAIGTSVQIRRTSLPAAATDISGFLSERFLWNTNVEGSDGSFSIPGLPSGRYVVEASAESAPMQTREVIAGKDAIKGIDFNLPIVLVSGAIVLDDGRAVPDAQRLGSIIFSSVGSDEDTSSIFRVSNAGTFGGVLEPGEYRVDLPSLPWDYSIVAITAGGRDLLKETFKMTDSDSQKIEVKVERLSGK